MARRAPSLFGRAGVLNAVSRALTWQGARGEWVVSIYPVPGDKRWAWLWATGDMQLRSTVRHNTFEDARRDFVRAVRRLSRTIDHLTGGA